MSKKLYAYIKPSEDGRPFDMLSDEELKEFLDDPRGYCGITKFMGAARLKEDPKYWKEGEGVLVSFEILTPRKTDGWVL